MNPQNGAEGRVAALRHWVSRCRGCSRSRLLHRLAAWSEAVCVLSARQRRASWAPGDPQMLLWAGPMEFRFYSLPGTTLPRLSPQPPCLWAPSEPCPPTAQLGAPSGLPGLYQPERRGKWATNCSGTSCAEQAAPSVQDVAVTPRLPKGAEDALKWQLQARVHTCSAHSRALCL